jgi:hypothetical protein
MENGESNIRCTAFRKEITCKVQETKASETTASSRIFYDSDDHPHQNDSGAVRFYRVAAPSPAAPRRDPGFRQPNILRDCFTLILRWLACLRINLHATSNASSPRGKHKSLNLAMAVENFLFLVPFGISLYLYGLTMNPDMAPGDWGELVTNAYLLSPSHPPGYPLFVIIYHLWIHYISDVFMPAATVGT